MEAKYLTVDELAAILDDVERNVRDATKAGNIGRALAVVDYHRYVYGLGELWPTQS